MACRRCPTGRRADPARVGGARVQRSGCGRCTRRRGGDFALVPGGVACPPRSVMSTSPPFLFLFWTCVVVPLTRTARLGQLCRVHPTHSQDYTCTCCCGSARAGAAFVDTVRVVARAPVASSSTAEAFAYLGLRVAWHLSRAVGGAYGKAGGGAPCVSWWMPHVHVFTRHVHWLGRAAASW